jgi:hypothetical protein
MAGRQAAETWATFSMAHINTYIYFYYTGEFRFISKKKLKTIYSIRSEVILPDALLVNTNKNTQTPLDASKEASVQVNA